MWLRCFNGSLLQPLSVSGHACLCVRVPPWGWLQRGLFTCTLSPQDPGRVGRSLQQRTQKSPFHFRKRMYLGSCSPDRDPHDLIMWV